MGLVERLHNRRAGTGDPLLLIHGIGGSLRTWSPILGLAEGERDVLAIDLPGFGESPPLPSDLTPDLDALATAVEAELDAAGVETAAIAGNSLGGWIALELARRGRARSVVAVSPAGMWTDKERAWADRYLRTQFAVACALAPRTEVLRSPVVRTLLLGGVSARPWRWEPDDVIYGMRALARSNFLPTLEAVTAECCRGLEEIRCPVLILWGTRDWLLPLRQARRFVRHIPDARLMELPRLGHVPMADDPELVGRTILEFTAA